MVLYFFSFKNALLKFQTNSRSYTKRQLNKTRRIPRNRNSNRNRKLLLSLCTLYLPGCNNVDPMRHEASLSLQVTAVKLLKDVTTCTLRLSSKSKTRIRSTSTRRNRLCWLTCVLASLLFT